MGGWLVGGGLSAGGGGLLVGAGGGGGLLLHGDVGGWLVGGGLSAGGGGLLVGAGGGGGLLLHGLGGGGGGGGLVGGGGGGGEIVQIGIQFNNLLLRLLLLLLLLLLLRLLRLLLPRLRLRRLLRRQFRQVLGHGGLDGGGDVLGIDVVLGGEAGRQLGAQGFGQLPVVDEMGQDAWHQEVDAWDAQVLGELLARQRLAHLDVGVVQLVEDPGKVSVGRPPGIHLLDEIGLGDVQPVHVRQKEGGQTPLNRLGDVHGRRHEELQRAAAGGGGRRL